MTPDLLICWYALGWTACGVDFALSSPMKRQPVAKLLVIGPVMLAGLIVGAAICPLLHPDTSKQYLWRKP